MGTTQEWEGGSDRNLEGSFMHQIFFFFLFCFVCGNSCEVFMHQVVEKKNGF